MDTSDTRYIYSCDVKSSTVTYPVVDTATSESTEMWDDEPAPWDMGDPAPEEAAVGAAAEGAPAESVEAAVILPKDREKAPKPEYTLHWVRPLFLNYDYLYDYRQNYYNDYIDYLDKRQRGIDREVPRAQEWSERALRTYFGKVSPMGKRGADMRWITGFRTTTRYYSYHTRAYYSLKYMKIL